MSYLQKAGLVAYAGNFPNLVLSIDNAIVRDWHFVSLEVTRLTSLAQAPKTQPPKHN